MDRIGCYPLGLVDGREIKCHFICNVLFLPFSFFLTNFFFCKWRWILFILFLSTELMLILSSSPFNHPHTTLPTPLSLLFPRHRVIFQHILFLHHLYPILNIILSRIVPLFFFFSQQEVDARMERAIIEKTRTMVNLADREGRKIKLLRCWEIDCGF